MSYENFPHALRRACSMNGNVPWLAERVRSGDVDAYVKQVSRAIHSWWSQAPADVQSKFKDGFPASFQEYFREHLRQVSERRHEIFKELLKTASAEQSADFCESSKEIGEPIANPMVVPREIFRSQEKGILHCPYQGFVTTTHHEGTVQVDYQPYQHLHVHLRNFNHPKEDSLHEQMHAILLEQYGDEGSKDLRAIDVVENGWFIAQKLGVMLTVTHQEGGDPDTAEYSYYGPFYPHEFFVREDDGNYAFEYAFDFVTLSL